MEKRLVWIFTDGACSGNPGPGGWAALIKAPSCWYELWGCETDTTNNRMELISAIKGLDSALGLYGTFSVTLVSDSQYVVKGATEWVENWRNNGWRTSQKKPVENQDLWEKIIALKEGFKDLSWQWVRGHSGHTENESVDRRAQWAMRGQQTGETILTKPTESENPQESQICS